MINGWTDRNKDEDERNFLFFFIDQWSPNLLQIGPYVNIENYGWAGYNILYGNFINNTVLYGINIVNTCELIL